MYFEEAKDLRKDVATVREVMGLITYLTLRSRSKAKASRALRVLKKLAAQIGVLYLLEEEGLRLLTLPRRRTTTKGPIKQPDHFSSIEFVEQFRFRKAHFWEILGQLRLTNGQKLMDGDSIQLLKYGEEGHYGYVWADQALMVFLRRFATPSRWVDLQYILGGSRTKLSAVFNFMVTELYAVYSPLICDMHRFKSKFTVFADHLRRRGCPFKNLVAFFDGHFQPTTRPGGQGCVNMNLEDFQTFAGKERMHGLKYQSAVLPNGLALVWGPWRGVFHDSTMFSRSGVLQDLEDISRELGQDFIAFGDSAYPLNRYMQRILKGPATGEGLTAWERRYNALMARFRIIVENVFAVCEQSWGILRDRHNLRLGNQAVGKLFPLAILFYNIRTILYGNNIVSYMGEDVLMDITLSEYLSFIIE